jgi:diguanylate cyclase (GGDEF)-like protein
MEVPPPRLLGTPQTADAKNMSNLPTAPGSLPEESEGLPPSGRRRAVIRSISLVLWISVLVVQGLTTLDQPGLVNGVILAGFALLFVAVNAQILIVRWVGERRWSRAMHRFNGSAYLSELENLPNRNYLLSELRREMPRARSVAVPFVLVILSLDSIDEIRSRRGDAFAERAVRGLADVVKRFARTSDFTAHLGGHRFCVMLNEARYEECFVFLQRVPGSIAVSDGRHMYEVPLSARVHEYDLEGLYATDVLRDAEETRPLRRREVSHFGSEAA